MPLKQAYKSPAASILILSLILVQGYLLPSALAQNKSPATFFYEKAVREAGPYETKQQAVKDIDRAINLEPNNAVFWQEKASILVGMEENEAALPCIDKALQIKPDMPLMLECKAYILNGLQRNDEALKVIDRAMKIDPNRSVRVTRAQILLSLFKFADAEKELDAIISKNPNDQIARTRRAVAADHLKHYDKEVEDLTALMRLTPPKYQSYTAHLYSRAQAYMALKQYDKAIADYKRGLELSGNKRQYHTGLIAAYQAKGDNKAANEERKKLSSLDEDIVPFK